MPRPVQSNRFTSICLIAAVAVPLLYFGAQVAAAPFYPGYRFAQDGASMLGTSSSLHPWIFNFGAILTGIAALAGAVGLYRAFAGATYPLLACSIGLSVVATGVMSVKAGLFPMPDPRHASWGFLSFFTIFTPLLMLFGLWTKREAKGMRLYLISCILLIALVFPVLTGMIHASVLPGGASQRLLAFATFVPVGVVGNFLRVSSVVRRETTR